MPRLTVNDVNFHYLDEGQGPVMFLLGGTLGTARGDFSAQLDAFCGTHRLIVPDRRGYGETRPPDRDFPDNFYEREARDMAGMVQALALQDMTVFGWSEGAAVALWLATLEPARVTAVVVWGGISGLSKEDLARFESRRDTAAWPARAQAAMSEIYGDGYWQRMWCEWLDTMQRLEAQGSARLAIPETIVCPVLVMHGAKDALISGEHPRELARRLPQARFYEIADGGHNVHLTQRDAFNDEVRAFVATQ